MQSFLAPLAILMQPLFVLTWYAIGLLAAAWAVYDMLTINTFVEPPLKVAWPIIIVFFSVIGVAFYWASCRPPGIGALSDSEARNVHTSFVEPRWKKVVGSDIHCVGGDGLGIMTAMVILRLVGASFWVEFWIEYAVGYALGWFIFQYWAMRHMGNSPLVALWKGGRAEFFSMATVMLGMGLVVRFVTPEVVGKRPAPTAAAFWGFAALGLLVGAVLTYPMNWWLVSIGWKQGMA